MKRKDIVHNERVSHDLAEVYRIAEQGVERGCFPLKAARNAFQVFRYAFQKWAEGKDRGRVLKAMLFRGTVPREVTPIIRECEMAITCEDPYVASIIENILRDDGYEETK